MKTPSIPSVSLEVWKEDRHLSPEPDGYLGRLWSGSVTVLAVADPDAGPTIGIFRDGKDHYIEQKDWLNGAVTAAQQRAHARYLAHRQFPDGTRVYGVSVPLRVDAAHAVNTVHYPENMLMLAQFVRAGGRPTDRVCVWKVALVSQDGEFFLTVHCAYDTTAHRDRAGNVCFPRLRVHRLLERILARHVPEDAALPPESAFVPEGHPAVGDLPTNVGVVEEWYDPRNMGCIRTAKGPARVHWRDVPPRPRRRFLISGERVTFTRLRKPPANPATDWRNLRKPRFKLQAYGVAPS